MKHMVHLVKASAVLAGMLAFSGVSFAQCKIVVVNMQEAVIGSNEGKGQNAKFDARVEEWKSKLDKLTNDIEAAQNKLKTQAGIASQDVINGLNKTIRDKTSEQTRMQEDATKDVDEYRDSLLSPIMKSAEEITQALSGEKGYGIVIDASAQNSSIVYAAKECDITNEVKTRMNAKSGVAAPAATAPKAPPTPPKTSTPPPSTQQSTPRGGTTTTPPK